MLSLLSLWSDDNDPVPHGSAIILSAILSISLVLKWTFKGFDIQQDSKKYMPLETFIPASRFLLCKKGPIYFGFHLYAEISTLMLCQMQNQNVGWFRDLVQSSELWYLIDWFLWNRLMLRLSAFSDMVL